MGKFQIGGRFAVDKAAAHAPRLEAIRRDAARGEKGEPAGNEWVRPELEEQDDQAVATGFGTHESDVRERGLIQLAGENGSEVADGTAQPGGTRSTIIGEGHGERGQDHGPQGAEERKPATECHDSGTVRRNRS